TFSARLCNLKKNMPCAKMCEDILKPRSNSLHSGGGWQSASAEKRRGVDEPLSNAAILETAESCSKISLCGDFEPKILNRFTNETRLHYDASAPARQRVN